MFFIINIFPSINSILFKREHFFSRRDNIKASVTVRDKKYKYNRCGPGNGADIKGNKIAVEIIYKKSEAECEDHHAGIKTCCIMSVRSVAVLLFNKPYKRGIQQRIKHAVGYAVKHAGREKHNHRVKKIKGQVHKYTYSENRNNKRYAVKRIDYPHKREAYNYKDADI